MRCRQSQVSCNCHYFCSFDDVVVSSLSDWIAVIDVGWRSWQSTSVAEVLETIPLEFHIDLLPKHAFRPSMSMISARYSRSITSARASVLAWTWQRRRVRCRSWLISLVVEFIARMIASLSSAAHLLASSLKLDSRSATSRRSALH